MTTGETKTAKTIAEVLAEHTAWATTNPDDEWLFTCVDCKATIGTYDSIVPKEVDRNGGSYDLLDAALAAHQAAALSAAGFGLVTDAKAEAALEAAQDIVDGLTESCPDATLAIGFVEGYRDACEDAVTKAAS